MSKLFKNEIPNLEALFVRGPDTKICDWQGRKALHLSGEGPSLLVVPDLFLSQGRIEVDIGSDGAAFLGIAFRILDSCNYELAYVQPHTSGKWDAIQYDPVFHGSNTWQLYFGTGAQKSAVVPQKTWSSLQIDFQDQRALIQVGDQEPLIVNRLAHTHNSGLVGLWAFQSAYFANLRINENAPKSLESLQLTSIVKSIDGLVSEWFLEGFGVVDTEENGILNLNRYLPFSQREVSLVQQIKLPEDGLLRFNVGFSDELTLKINNEVIFQGENLYQDSPNWEDRGYVTPSQQVSCHLSKGIHRITAHLKAKEDFGFGIVVGIEGDEYEILPAHLCK